jgi:branched-chain amino acid transport system substrate-binding protein
MLTLLTLIWLLPSCRKPDKTPEPQTETITIGALLSLTGNWSTLGITSKAAIEIAVEEVNEYLRDAGSPYRLAADIADTKLDTAQALQHIKHFQESGYTFVIGPQSSAEAGAVKSFADANDMLVISQGSTAGSLSIEDDNLFRFCPADKIEGAAIARTMHQLAVRAVVTVARDDAGNRGLQTATGASFAALGGTVSAIPAYGTTVTDFSAVLAEIKSRIASLTGTYGTSGTGVYLASFDEFVNLFRQAAGDPVLESVRWYGSDGVALSAALVANTQASEFALKTSYFAPTFGLPLQAQSKWEPLTTAIRNKTGIAPDAFALAAYDAVWVIALSYHSAGEQPPFAKLKEAFVENANRYYGATGSTMLNNAGDRATGTFDYWGIVYENGSYKWKLTGRSE